MSSDSSDLSASFLGSSSFFELSSLSDLVASCLLPASLSPAVAFLSSDSSDLSASFFGSSSFFELSGSSLMVMSTVRPSEVTTSPFDLIRTSTFEPSASSSVADSPASST